jgi:hypothetical protein
VRRSAFLFVLRFDKAMPALVGFMLNENRLDKASFTATYGRK